LSSNLSAPGKPSARLWSVLTFILMLDAMLFLERAIAIHQMWTLVLYCAASPLVVWMWIGHTMNCLRDLGLSRGWVILNVLLVAASVWFDFGKWRNASAVALAVALAVQLLFAIMKPSQDSGVTDALAAARPPA
jgi:hypothetical protein